MKMFEVSTSLFAELSNCWNIYAFGVLKTICSALSKAPLSPLLGSVNTISAPNARRSMRLSTSIDEGIVAISLYPLAAATEAKPMPVFPVVGSTKMVCTGRKYMHILTYS
jgi:hypothetical protein